MTLLERQLMHKYIDKLKDINKGGDKEGDHCIADEALIDFLKEVGFGDLAKAYEDAEERAGGFWYA